MKDFSRKNEKYENQLISENLKNKILNKFDEIFNRYNYIYINNESAGVAGLRTLVWTTSLGLSFALYILAARKV